MEYIMFFAHTYILVHIFCVICIILAYIVLRAVPDFLDWLIILSMAPILMVASFIIYVTRRRI